MPAAKPQSIKVISYPKTGRTWLRLLVGKALCDRHGLDEQLMFDFRRLAGAAGLPAVSFRHDGTRASKQRHYSKLSVDKTKYGDSRVILLIRDPRDVVVSHYFQTSRRTSESKRYVGTLSDFIRDGCYGIEKVVTFYNIWHANQHAPAEFLLLRYEEMHADPSAVLRSFVQFLGAPQIDSDAIDRAVGYASFDHAQKLEETGHFDSKKLRPWRASDPESYKVRRGKVSGYVDYLTPEDCEYADAVIRRLGCAYYPTT